MSGHVSPKSIYYVIFGALMVLTAVTVAVAFINLGSLNFPVAIGIAITKATLVILFFMHVKYRMTSVALLIAIPSAIGKLSVPRLTNATATVIAVSTMSSPKIV